LKRQNSSVLRKIKQKIEIIQQDPYWNSHNVVALKWKENTFRLRIGNIRLIYEIQDDVLFIYFYLADFRGSVYDKFRKK